MKIEWAYKSVELAGIVCEAVVCVAQVRDFKVEVVRFPDGKYTAVLRDGKGKDITPLVSVYDDLHLVTVADAQARGLYRLRGLISTAVLLVEEYGTGSLVDTLELIDAHCKAGA